MKHSYLWLFIQQYMSTVDVLEDVPAFSFPTTLPTNVTVTADILQEEFVWLCFLVASSAVFLWQTLKRKA